MVEAVQDAELFHVVQKVAYNTFATPTVGSKIVAGEIHNPFFAYYDQLRTLNVRMPDGSVTELGALLWLENVKTGAVTPDDLPTQAHNIAKHFQMLARELAVEMVRTRFRPDAPSRWSCLWTSATFDEARYWSQRLTGSNLILRLSATGVIHRCDAAYLASDGHSFSQMIAMAESYWRGDRADPSEPEILLCGSAKVIETISVA